MSMNVYLGGLGGDYGLSGDLGPYVRRRLLQDLPENSPNWSIPGPSRIFVFLDMRQDSIDMGNFAPDMAGWPDQPANYSFFDLPGSYHMLARRVFRSPTVMRKYIPGATTAPCRRWCPKAFVERLVFLAQQSRCRLAAATRHPAQNN